MSPFTNASVYLPGIPVEACARGDIEMRFNKSLEEMDKTNFGLEKRQAGNLTLGYSLPM